MPRETHADYEVLYHSVAQLLSRMRSSDSGRSARPTPKRRPEAQAETDSKAKANAEAESTVLQVKPKA
eukprot:3321799-Pyramimonas_sp.AAC.1